eukprot:jgi/Chrzof1/12643/Cz07g02040.t1
MLPIRRISQLLLQRAACSQQPTPAAVLLAWGRRYSDSKLDASQEDVAELLEATVVKAPKRKEEDRPKLLTTRREALSLYREVLRYSNLFVWTDDKGRNWRDVIRDSARKEFEAARSEQDPEMINRMIITGRDAVRKTVDRFMQKRATVIDEEMNPQRPNQ